MARMRMSFQPAVASKGFVIIVNLCKLLSKIFNIKFLFALLLHSTLLDICSKCSLLQVNGVCGSHSLSQLTTASSTKFIMFQFVVKTRRKRLGEIHRNSDYIDDFQIYYILTHLGVSSNVIGSVCRIGVNNA